jgi:hypothetical protein
MRTVFILFDSLVRNALGCYGGTTIATPNFDRFAEKAVIFDTHYVGSLPCMPARRDMQTGRLSFLHRSWGPLEPFDNSFPELLRQGGEPIPVDYLMRQSGGRWKVFDVQVEGVSFVSTFRRQFDNELQRKSIRQVATELRRGQLQVDAQ